MTHRERILAVIRGEIPDHLPWVPRLEFWYRARLRDGTLPEEYRSLSLTEIADRLGAGYYAVIPGAPEQLGQAEVIDSALGIRRLPVLPYEVTLDGVERRVSQRGRETVVEYCTPLGVLRTAHVFTDEMLQAGASKPWTTEHAIREPRDMGIAGYVFSHLKVTPRFDGYLAVRERVGDRGLVVACANGAACPVQLIMKELMPVEQFFYALHDCPQAVERLAVEMEPYFQGVRQAAADSPAEVVLLGGNYEGSITHPRFFRRYILPALRGYAESLHRRGKYLLTHTDGENRGLLGLYVEAGIDIADSICPWPMTSCRLEDIRAAFAGRVTIWGGIPAILLCPESASFEEFRRFADETLARYGHKSRLILGVSDMVPADCDWARVRYLSDAVQNI